MLVPERGEPTTKTGLFILLCILVRFALTLVIFRSASRAGEPIDSTISAQRLHVAAHRRRFIPKILTKKLESMV